MKKHRRLAIAWILAALPAAAGEVVVPVQHDSWIEGLSSTSVHGHDPSMTVCPAPNYWMYFQFDLGSIDGEIVGAELRVTRIDGERPEEIDLFLITDDGWSESTLTGLTRPAPLNPANETALAVGAAVAGYDRWKSTLLADTVAAELAGDGILSLMAREQPFQAVDLRRYRSKEAAVPDSQKPRLVVTCLAGEVTNLVATSAEPTVLAWEGGALWDVAGGTLADLRSDGGVAAAGCLAEDLAQAGFEDPRPAPPPGEAFYYLIRAGGLCGDGVYGYGSDGSERQPIGACP